MPRPVAFVRAAVALLLASGSLVAWVLPAAHAAQPAGAPAQAAPSISAGAWRGGPVADGSGQAQACAMFAPAGRGMQLFFRLSSTFDFSLGLVYPQWNFTPETPIPMVYRVDGGAPVQVQARATRRDTILIDISDRESIFQAFRRGLYLTLSTQNANARFSLKGTSVALEQLRICATALAAAAPPAPPQEPPPRPEVPPGGK